MVQTSKKTFPKSEKLCSHLAIEELFQGGHRSMAVYPLRVVFRPTNEPGIKILISVPKRLFKHAVERNRIKRQVREAYRQQKELLSDMSTPGLHIAFLWISKEIFPTKAVFSKMKNLLQQIHEKNS